MYAQRIGPILAKDVPHNILQKYFVEDEDFFTGEKVTVQLCLPYKNNHYFLPRYSVPVNESYLVKGDPISIICKAKPRNKIQQQAVDYMINHKDCLISLKPRRGKTVIAIMALSKIKKKTLVLVDQTKILEQWIERICEFTNYTKNDIGIFQADKEELDKPIVIGMVQTLKNRVQKNVDDIRNKLKSFGLVIVDEVHVIVGTEKLSLPLYAISSERLVGLTATTYRSDGKDFLFEEWFSSNIFYDSKYDIIPKVFMTPISSYTSQKSLKWIMENYFQDENGELQKKDFFNKLKWTKKVRNDKLFMSKLSSLVKSLYDKNRTILIISEYVDFLQVLANYCIKLKIPKTEMELFTDSIGSTKSIKKVLEPSRDNNKKITFTTYKMCSKAIDRPDWDALIMLTPVSSRSPVLEQTVGRVCTLCEGKEDALIYDIYDPSIPRLVHMAKSRERVYLEEFGFEVVKSVSQQENISNTSKTNIIKPVLF